LSLITDALSNIPGLFFSLGYDLTNSVQRQEEREEKEGGDGDEGVSATWKGFDREFWFNGKPSLDFIKRFDAESEKFIGKWVCPVIAGCKWNSWVVSFILSLHCVPLFTCIHYFFFLFFF